MTGNGSAPGAKRGAYKRVAESLRHEIEHGDIEVGEQLPTHFELVERYDVSRATVQRALKELQDAGYVEPEQGRGVFVVDWRARSRARSDDAREHGDPDTVELDDAIAEAFEADEITIDAYCLTAESLHAAVVPQVRRIIRGELRPGSIRVRLLLPRLDARLAIPRSVNNPEDERPLERLREEVGVHTRATLKNLLEDLVGRDRVDRVNVEIKEVPITPVFKVYLVNERQVLMGYYAVKPRSVDFKGEELAIYDVDGLGVSLYPQGPVQRTATKAWFESLWETIAESPEEM